MRDDEVWLVMPAAHAPGPWAQRAREQMVVLLEESGAGPILDDRSGLAHLSADDERIAGLVAQGRSAYQIATELYVTERTVYRRLARLKKIMDVRTGAELVAKLAELGY